MSTNYCWVRQDLSRPQQTVQAGHAYAQAAVRFGCPADTNLIVYGVEGEYGMHLVRDDLIKKMEKHFDLEFYTWREPDMENEITAICTNVLPDRYPPFSKYCLLV